MGLPTVIKYPNYDHVKNKQKFPHRTFAMLCSLAAHILISSITNVLFIKKIVPIKYDFLHCFEEEEKTNPSSVSLTNLTRDDKKKNKKIIKTQKEFRNGSTTAFDDPAGTSK